MKGEAVELVYLPLVVDMVVLGLLILQGLVVVIFCLEYIPYVLHNALCLRCIGMEVMRNEDIELILVEWANVDLNDLVLCIWNLTVGMMDNVLVRICYVVLVKEDLLNTEAVMVNSVVFVNIAIQHVVHNLIVP